MKIEARTLSFVNKTRSTSSLCSTLALSAAIGVIGFSGVQSFAQTATLSNGTILTRKSPLEVFATEGPIADIDIANKTISVTGKVLTFPVTVNGLPHELSGSSALGQDGEAATGISAANFDRLLDANATGRDVNILDPSAATREANKDRRGAVRSIFSSIEAGRTDGTAPASRDALALEKMKANYFDYVQKAYAVQAAHLPPNFLDLAGFRTGGNVYPATAGATLKSAGHVYSDSLGNDYFVTDIETVLELSENVASGIVKNIDPGDKLTGRPASMVIGDLLMIFNQDPRFGMDIFGILETEIPFSLFVANGTGLTVDTIGHMIGGHVLFVQELVTELLDTSQGIFAITERWQFDNEANEIRFRGEVSEVNTGTADEIIMEVQISDGSLPITIQTYDVEILPPEAGVGVGVGAGTTPGGVFGFRVRDDINVAGVEFVTIKLLYKNASDASSPIPHVAGQEAFSETIAGVDVDLPRGD